MQNKYTKLAVSLFSLALLSSPTYAKETLKLSHFFSTSIGMHKEFIEPWIDELESCSNGEISVEVHGAGTALGDITKQYDQVRAGVTDIAFGHTGIPRGRFPRTALIELPFMAKSANANSFALWNLSSTLLKPDYPNTHILALVAQEPGLIHSNKPINSLNDLKGMRIRTPNPSVSAVLEYYGAEPVGLPPSQMYENLQKGTIDGVTIDWYGMGAFKLNEVVSHHLEIPFYTVGFFFVMNERTYKGLTPNVRECVDRISGSTLVAKFGPLFKKWASAGLKQEMDSSDDIIKIATPEEVDIAQQETAQVTKELLQAAIDLGVENAEEVRSALALETSKYD